MTIISFPETEFILKCRECKTNAFYVMLNSNNPFDIKWLECSECGIIFDPNETNNISELKKI